MTFIVNKCQLFSWVWRQLHPMCATDWHFYFYLNIFFKRHVLTMVVNICSWQLLWGNVLENFTYHIQIFFYFLNYFVNHLSLTCAHNSCNEEMICSRWLSWGNFNQHLLTTVIMMCAMVWHFYFQSNIFFNICSQQSLWGNVLENFTSHTQIFFYFWNYFVNHSSLKCAHESCCLEMICSQRLSWENFNPFYLITNPYFVNHSSLTCAQDGCRWEMICSRRLSWGNFNPFCLILIF